LSEVPSSVPGGDNDLASTPAEAPAGALDEDQRGPNGGVKLCETANATRVGTGASLHVTPVGRGVWSRRFNEIFRGLSRGLLSEEEKQLARRAASLCVLAEKAEVKLADGKEISAESYKQLADSVGRALERLAACRERNAPPAVLDENGKPLSLTRQWMMEQSPEKLRSLATEVVARGSGFVPPELASFIEERTGEKVEPVEPPLEVEDPLDTPEARAALAELAKCL
jgi:hypothetical protein